MLLSTVHCAPSIIMPYISLLHMLPVMVLLLTCRIRIPEPEAPKPDKLLSVMVLFVTEPVPLDPSEKIPIDVPVMVNPWIVTWDAVIVKPAEVIVKPAELPAWTVVASRPFSDWMVRLFPTTTFSGYVPSLTMIVSPSVAALTAAWMVVKSAPPESSTYHVFGPAAVTVM